MHNLNKITYHVEDEKVMFDSINEKEEWNHVLVDFYVSDETIDFIKEWDIEDIQREIIDEIKLILVTIRWNVKEHKVLKQFF